MNMLAEVTCVECEVCGPTSLNAEQMPADPLGLQETSSRIDTQVLNEQRLLGCHTHTHTLAGEDACVLGPQSETGLSSLWGIRFFFFSFFLTRGGGGW